MVSLLLSDVLSRLSLDFDWEIFFLANFCAFNLSLIFIYTVGSLVSFFGLVNINYSVEILWLVWFHFIGVLSGLPRLLPPGEYMRGFSPRLVHSASLWETCRSESFWAWVRYFFWEISILLRICSGTSRARAIFYSSRSLCIGASFWMLAGSLAPVPDASILLFK